MPEEPAAPPLVTAADISRLAGVTRATVSNWRKRHPDFPVPIGGTDTSPAYDVRAVTEWLAANDRLPEPNPIEGLRSALRLVPPGAVADVLPLVLAASRLHGAALDELLGLQGDAFDQRTAALVAERAPEVPAGSDLLQDGLGGAELRHAVVSCVRAGKTDELLAALDHAQQEGTSARGQYATPAPLAALIAVLATTELDGTAASGFDPACGTGGLLLALRDRGIRALAGQDLLPARTVRTAVRLALGTEGPSEQLTSRAGDSLRADAFPGLRADVVVCNPPYGDSDWGQEELSYDERWAYGVPTAKDSELAWLQHCLAHLRPGGRAVLLLPPAVAGRTSGRRIRAELVRRGALRAVVALPAGAAPPPHIGLHLWILERPTTELMTPDRVLFVDASRDGAGATVRLGGARGATAGGQPATHWRDVHDTVVQAWRDPEKQPGVARVVAAIDLLDDAVDLTPQRQVPVAAHTQSPEEVAQSSQLALESLREAGAGLADLSHAGAWPSAQTEARSWRTATVGDLLRGGALTLVRGAVVVPRGSSEALEQDRRVLMARDLGSDTGPSGTVATVGERVRLEAEVQEGDVILSEVFHEQIRVGVATSEDHGALLGPHLLLLRPDEQRLDPHFLAGFLAAPGNAQRAVSGTSIMRVDARRLQLPLIPLTEQRRYGEAFQRLRQLSRTARQVASLGYDAAEQLTWGLTSGALLPPEGL
ncbi:N-6 DNA methylase [Kitasatospora purpeofusca]|uniref:N-6 DNA methylase n=1 Tax=Kitasatospora purpeofusca TaxID=67352 RepID=UPI0038705E63|nr:N-6 DNA methylase [Kitasatospora purpeofusca]